MVRASLRKTGFLAVTLAVTSAGVFAHHDAAADSPAAPSAPPAPAPVATPTPPPVATPVTPAPPPPHVAWQEHFNEPVIDWLDPFDHGSATVARVYTIRHEDGFAFLHARHDSTQSSRPPALDYGHPFQHGAPPLEKVRALKWRWRALRQPTVDDDAWDDMAASIYVVIKVPSLLVGGKGFKFGWLSKPGERGTHQHGLLQIQQRVDPVGPAWKSESVDLCALFRREYGKCEGEHVLYVGVVSDSDDTKSVAEADYADFEIDVAP